MSDVDRIGAGPEDIWRPLKIPIDNFFIQANDGATTLAADVAVDDVVATVTDPSTFSIGDYVTIRNPESIYFGEVLLVAGNDITFDSPFPFAYQSGDTIQSFTRDLNVDGSVTSQTFSLFGSGAMEIQINLTRLVFNCLTAAPVDLSRFGDIIGGLTNGIVLRGVPDPSSGLPAANQWNLKTNGDIDTLTGTDWKPYSALNPAQGQDGFTARYTYGSPDKHDVIPPIVMGDRIDLIVQDDLTQLLTFRLLFAGNRETIT